MSDDAQADLDRLWASYRATGRRDLRDQLIVHYAPMVRLVANSVAKGLPHRVDQNDLMSYGVFGLIDAIDRFEPERGYKFETFAMPRVRGAIVDELRSIDWVPRSVRAKGKAIEQAYATLEARLHRTPTEVELAGALGIRLEQLQSALTQISSAGLAALDEQVADDDAVTLGDTVVLDDGDDGPVASYEVDEMRQILAEAINRMPERDKLVLTLYYYEGLTLAEIGRVLDVTESRICQIHTKAVLQLRSRLATAERESA